MFHRLSSYFNNLGDDIVHGIGCVYVCIVIAGCVAIALVCNVPFQMATLVRNRS